jgi:CRP-like cAMP-binding protein
MDVPAGRVLSREGESGRQFFVIVEGEVELTKNGEHVRRIGVGGFFGETSLVEHEPSTTTATALTPLRFFVLPSQSFWSLVLRNPVIHCRVLRDLVLENISERKVAETQWRRQVEVNAYEAVHDSLTTCRTGFCSTTASSTRWPRRSESPGRSASS